VRVAAGQVVLMDPDRNASSTEEDALESGQGWLGFFDTSPACTLVYQVCCVVCALSLYILFLPLYFLSLPPNRDARAVKN